MGGWKSSIGAKAGISFPFDNVMLKYSIWNEFIIKKTEETIFSFGSEIVYFIDCIYVPLKVRRPNQA